MKLIRSRRTPGALLLAALAVGLMAALPGPGTVGVQAASGTTYHAPYKAGPSGPVAEDPQKEHRTHYTDVNTETGEITLAWVNTTPGAIGCAAQGGFAFLSVDHVVSEAISSVAVVYENATITPFTFLKVNVRQAVEGGAKEYIGSTRVRGQMAHESGVLIVDLDGSPAPGSVITVDFGMETASACPNADGGQATFSAVSVY